MDCYNFREQDSAISQLASKSSCKLRNPLSKSSDVFRRPQTISRERNEAHDLGSMFRPRAENARTETERVQSSCSAYRSNGSTRKPLTRSEIKLSLTHSRLENAFRPQSTQKTVWNQVRHSVEDPYLDPANGFVRKRKEHKEMPTREAVSRSLVDLRATTATSIGNLGKSTSKFAPALVYDHENQQLLLRPTESVRSRPPTTTKRPAQVQRDRTYFKSVEASIAFNKVGRKPQTVKHSIPIRPAARKKQEVLAPPTLDSSLKKCFN